VAVGASLHPEEVRFRPQHPKLEVQQFRRLIEVEGIHRSHDDMDLSVELRLQLLPVTPDDGADVVIVAPVARYLRIDLAGDAVEQGLRPAILAAGGEDPVEG